MKKGMSKVFIKKVIGLIEKSNKEWSKAVTPCNYRNHATFGIQFDTGIDGCNNWIIISVDGDLFINGYLVAKNLNARTLKKRYWDLF